MAVYNTGYVVWNLPRWTGKAVTRVMATPQEAARQSATGDAPPQKAAGGANE